MTIEETFKKLRSQGFKPVTSNDTLEICSYLIGMDSARLKQVIQDKTLPVIFRILAKELLSEKGLAIVGKFMDSSYLPESETKTIPEQQKIIVQIMEPKELRENKDLG